MNKRNEERPDGGAGMARNIRRDVREEPISAPETGTRDGREMEEVLFEARRGSGATSFGREVDDAEFSHADAHREQLHPGVEQAWFQMKWEKQGGCPEDYDWVPPERDDEEHDDRYSLPRAKSRGRAMGNPHGRLSSWIVVGTALVALIVGAVAFILHAWVLVWICAVIVVLCYPAGLAIHIMDDTVSWAKPTPGTMPRGQIIRSAERVYHQDKQDKQEETPDERRKPVAPGGKTPPA